MNSLQKCECWDARFVNKGGGTGENQCYHVNKTLGSILGKVLIWALDNHCDAAVEV